MITVLLAVNNGERWLKESISSILNQTYKDFEFLIINDGSNDNSLQIIKDFAQKDKRINYISHENIGLTASLNKGLSIAKGDWIARIDCDDISCPKRLEFQLKYAEKNNLGLVGCQSYQIDASGCFKRKLFVPIKHRQICSNLKRQKIMFCHSSTFFKKDLVLNLGGYREVMKRSQDYDLWLRISEISKIGCLRYVGNYLRDHETRISKFDSGKENTIYTYCANISFLLRKKYGKKYDPLNNLLPQKNIIFKKFVEDNLKQEGILDFHKRLNKFKKETEEKNLINKIFIFLLYFNNLRILLKLIKWLTFGDFTSEQLSSKWLIFEDSQNLIKN